MAELGRVWCNAEQNKLEGVDQTSKELIQLLESIAVTPGDQKAHAHFMHGRILMKLGQFAQAKDAYERAWTPVYQYAGVQFTGRQILIRNVAECCQNLGDSAASTHWLEQLERDPSLLPDPKSQ